MATIEVAAYGTIPMKKLTVQLQPELLSADVCKSAISALTSLGANNAIVSSVTTVRGEECGGYINVEFECSDIPRLWRVIAALLFSNKPELEGVQAGIIVICQGDSGWDDYLLLHHSDPSVQLDEIGEGRDKGSK